jgi:hypothetical protein
MISKVNERLTNPRCAHLLIYTDISAAQKRNPRLNDMVGQAYILIGIISVICVPLNLCSHGCLYRVVVC